MSQVVADGKDKQKDHILNDNLWRVMFNLSWPAIVAMVLYGVNAVISAAFVGRYVGETALAGVSVAYPLTQISTGIGSLIGVGAGAVLSIAIGRQDKGLQERLMGNVNYLTLIVTAIYMVVGLLFSTPLIKMMGGEGETLALGDQYFTITVIGSLFWIYGLATNMIVRAEGKMKSAAVIMAIGLLADVVAHYILVAVLDFGVAGSAWAINFGMFVYAVLGWMYFGKGFSSFKTKVFSLRRDREAITSVLRLGAASLIMNFMSLIQAIVVLNALAKYGTVFEIAFYGVLYRIFTFLLTPIFGLMRALQPVIGINYGAKQYSRVISSYKIFAVTAMLLTLPFWLITMVIPETVLGFMMPDQTFTAANILNFQIFTVILPLLSIIFMAMTLFPSIDKGKPAAMIGMARQFVFYVPVMLILPKYMGVAGVYYGSLAIDLLIVLWTVYLVRKEFNGLRAREVSYS